MRCLSHLEKAAGEFPEWVSPDVVRFPSIMKPDQERVMIAGSNFTVVEGDFLREGSRLPAHHPGTRHRNPINGPPLDWPISTHHFKTRSSKQLTRTRHMFQLRELMRIRVAIVSIVIYNERRTCNPELWILRKFVEQKLEVVAVECDICVEITNDVELDRL